VGLAMALPMAAARPPEANFFHTGVAGGRRGCPGMIRNIAPEQKPSHETTTTAAPTATAVIAATTPRKHWETNPDQQGLHPPTAGGGGVVRGIIRTLPHTCAFRKTKMTTSSMHW